MAICANRKSYAKKNGFYPQYKYLQIYNPSPILYIQKNTKILQKKKKKKPYTDNIRASKRNSMFVAVML